MQLSKENRKRQTMVGIAQKTKDWKTWTQLKYGEEYRSLWDVEERGGEK
jgi:hypothetical protein